MNERSARRDPQRIAPDGRTPGAAAGEGAREHDPYRDIFLSLHRGFCVLEMEDADGRGPDARFLEANAAFEGHTGLSGAAGETVLTLIPDLDPIWLETWRRVAQTGIPAKLLGHVSGLGRWIDAEIHRFGTSGRCVAVLLADVSEPHRAEETLRASEARFRFTADSVPQIVWIADGNGRTQFLNKRWTDFTGDVFEPLEADRLAERYIHPEDIAGALAAFEQSQRESSVFQVELRIRGRDGGYRWFLVRGEPFRAEDGLITNWFGASTDIHERKKAQAALEASEERLRLIVENARGYAIFLTDADDRIVDWWPGAAEIFGWSAEEIAGRTARLLYTEEDVAAGVPEAELGTARRDGIAPDIRWHRRKDGSRVFIDGSVIALRDRDDGLRGFLKIGQDVTARELAQAALRDSEQRFRQFGDASSDLLWIRDADSLRFEYLSPACTKILGVDCSELQSGEGLDKWQDLVDPIDRDALLAHLAHVRAGERVTCDFRIRRATDGEPRWLQDTGFPLLDASGRITRIAGIAKDVTSQKETRDRLKVLVSELQHRTRNLLAVVQALAERTIVSSASLEDFRVRFYPRLGALARVNELLSRLESDDRVTFDQLVRVELSAHGALEGGADAANVRLDGPPGIRLRSSTIQTLALALHELCTNSLKYGALARRGQLDLRWEEQRGEDGERRLLFTWIESGLNLPPDETGAGRRGFGRELIERALPRQLKTDVDYRILPDGVRCTISLPLSQHPGQG